MNGQKKNEMTEENDVNASVREWRVVLVSGLCLYVKARGREEAKKIAREQLKAQGSTSTVDTASPVKEN